MRLTIILLLVSSVCFGQPPFKDAYINNQTKGTDTIKSTSGKLSSADSLALPIFSTKEVMDYIYRIEKVAASIKNLPIRLTGDQEYNQLVTELSAIIKEMDKKRKGIK